jgi:hypothetical protein
LIWRWVSAIMLPTKMVSRPMAMKRVSHFCANPAWTVKTERKIRIAPAAAAVLPPTAISAVTGVGAPW